MVNCRFIGILERRNLISYAQCAFRQDWFTVDHLLNLEHRVRFSSHAQTSCFRLRRGESVWHHLAIRHFEKLWLMESDRSTTAFSFCFSTGSLFLCSSWKCLSLVMLKEMRMTQGSLSSVMFATAIEGMTHAFDLSVSASLYRPLQHRPLQPAINRLSRWAEENVFSPFSATETQFVHFWRSRDSQSPLSVPQH